ncbi:MAG: hypothetical protein IKK13_06770 [Clostridia bacterium]|nr:hypothetical protein [Clostridia bacterium]MBR3961892.1 hypothetical protein [Clostridia bacterium]
MKKHLIPINKNFYKANMHCHSDWSDGTYTPEELKKLYKEQGYSVLAITDHEGLFYHSELDDPEFLTVPSLEYEFNEQRGENFDNWIVCHLCIYKKDKSDIYQIGIDPDWKHPKFKWMHDERWDMAKSKGEILNKAHTPEAINLAIKRLRDEGFIVTYNHPRWSMEDYSVYMQYEGMNNLEIFNTGTILGGFDDDNGVVFDDMLRSGKRVFCVAADDNHTPNDMFGGFIMLAADSLDYDKIISAFENGEFYASCGPIIEDIYVEDGVFGVKTSTPAKAVCFHTGTRHSACQKAEDELFEAKFTLHEDDIYVRAEIIDKDGKKAYTQAYFLAEI